MKSKSKPLCCYFHSAYVSVRVVQVPKRGLDFSLLDSPTLGLFYEPAVLRCFRTAGDSCEIFDIYNRFSKVS